MGMLEAGFSNPLVRRASGAGDAARMLEKTDAGGRIKESLNAPGRVPVGFVEPEASKIAESVGRFLNATANVLGQAADAKKEMDNALMKEESERVVGAVLKATGDAQFQTKEAKSLYQRIQAQKDAASFNPESVSPVGDEKIGDAMLRHINETSGDMPEEYRFEYFRLTLPKVAQHQADVVLKAQEDAIAEGMAAISNRAISDPDMTAVADDYKSLSKTTAKNVPAATLFLKTFGPALQHAVENGDTERAKMIQTMAGEYLTGPHAKLFATQATASVDRAERIKQQKDNERQQKLMTEKVDSVYGAAQKMYALDDLKGEFTAAVYNDKRERLVKEASAEAVGWLMDAKDHDSARKIIDYAKNEKFWNKVEAQSYLTAYRQDRIKKAIAVAVTGGDQGRLGFMQDIQGAVEAYARNPEDPAGLEIDDAKRAIAEAGEKAGNKTKTDAYVQQLTQAARENKSINVPNDAQPAMTLIALSTGMVKGEKVGEEDVAITDIEKPSELGRQLGQWKQIPPQIKQVVEMKLGSQTKEDFSFGMRFVSALRGVSQETADEFIAKGGLGEEAKAKVNSYLNSTYKRTGNGVTDASEARNTIHNQAVDTAWGAKAPLKDEKGTMIDTGWDTQGVDITAKARSELAATIPYEFQSSGEMGKWANWVTNGSWKIQELHISRDIVKEYMDLVKGMYTGGGETEADMAKAKAKRIIQSKYKPVYSPHGITLQQAPYEMSEEMYNQAQKATMASVSSIVGKDKLTGQYMSEYEDDLKHETEWRWRDNEKAKSMGQEPIGDGAGVWVLHNRAGIVQYYSNEKDPIAWLPDESADAKKMQEKKKWDARTIEGILNATKKDGGVPFPAFDNMREMRGKKPRAAEIPWYPEVPGVTQADQ